MLILKIFGVAIGLIMLLAGIAFVAATIRGRKQ